MPEVIIDGRGTGSTLQVNPDGSINVSGISAQIDITGYTTQEVIRKASGSPAVDYVLTAISESIMLDNLGSADVYFAFDSTADVTTEGTGIVPKGEARIFDASVGSVSIQSSGTTSSEVQVISLS